MGHEDDDRHDVESAPHRIFQDFVLFEEDVSDGRQWNVAVISPEEPQSDQPTWSQLTKVGGGRKNIAQYLRTGAE